MTSPQAVDLQRVSEKLRRGARLSPDDLRLPKIDQGRLLNSLHVPADAGPYAAQIEAILRRIPDNWGRMISCEKGWYPLIVELDGKLSALDPDHQIHQVKQTSKTSIRSAWRWTT